MASMSSYVQFLKLPKPPCSISLLRYQQSDQAFLLQYYNQQDEKAHRGYVQNADSLSIPSSAISLSVLPSVSMSNMLSMPVFETAYICIKTCISSNSGTVSPNRPRAEYHIQLKQRVPLYEKPSHHKYPIWSVPFKAIVPAYKIVSRSS